MSLNRVMLIGNVGRDPDVRYIDNGIAVATFPLATTERSYTLPNGVHVPERTEWHNIVMWRGLAQMAEKYVHKGDKLYIEGSLRTRTYDDKQGIHRSLTEVMAEKMEIMTARTSSDSSTGTSQSAMSHNQAPPSQKDGQLPF